MIKAPYNFVPLEDNAFYPGWANHISQDFPFEDGVSGCIGYTMKAETPIFVRNGYTDREHPDPSFSHTEDGRYFIPGTSVKGEIRNVLEILSFGKMTQVQDARFGIRVLSGPDRNNYTKQIKDEHCGWLFKDDNGSYKIIDCGIPGRIETRQLSRNLSQFMNNQEFDLDLFKRKIEYTEDDKAQKALNKEEIKRSATLKYFTYGYNSLSELLKMDFKREDKLNFTFSKIDIPNRNRYDNREFYRIAPQAAKQGTIILTGQPNSTKKYDFIFFEPTSNSPLSISDDVINDFRSIHKNNFDFNNIWDVRLENKREIPVFFTLKDGNVDAIGLSGMFRIPSANFIKGAIPAKLQSARRKDLAECIFGSAKKELGYLKGRVTFSPAFSTNGGTEMKDVETTLSSPKPSYGPLYVEGGTWNDSNARIKGRKRYPVRDIPVRNDETGNGNTETKFKPLDKGVEFSGKIYFHNLRKCELGALVSALTFNGHPECFHSIGEAKPLGYGKVKTNICSVTLKENTKDAKYSPIIEETELKAFIDTYLGEFKTMMTSANVGWSADCASIRDLQAMARGISPEMREIFSYMHMSTTPAENEFLQNLSRDLNSFTNITPNSTDSYAIEGNWTRKWKSDLEREILNHFGVDDEMKDIQKLIENKDYSTAYKQIAPYCDLSSKLNDENWTAINNEMLKIRNHVNSLFTKAESALTDKKFNMAIRCYQEIKDINIPEFNDKAEGEINLCSKIYPKIEELIKERNWDAAQNLINENNRNHSNRVLNDYSRHIEELIFEQKEKLYYAAKEQFEKASKSPKEQACQLYASAIGECEQALNININGYDNSKLLELKSKCNDKIGSLSRPTTIEKAFNGYQLNSIAAFAGRIHNWMRNSDTTSLNEEQIVFLGHLIQNGIAGLNKRDQRNWKDRKKWEKAFHGMLSTAAVDAIFAIATNE